MKFKLCLLVSLLLAQAASAATATHVVLTSSGSSQNLSGPGNGGTFEELPSGSPTTVSIVIKGCMYGGTCDTLDTNTSTAASNRQPTINSVYDYFTVTASWTGGTNVSVAVNATVAVAGKSGGGAPGGAAGGDLGSTYPNPTVTATHLGSALPLAQGGTAATSAAAALTSLGAEAVANKSTDGTFASNSDTLYPSQKAAKTYADTKQTALGFTPEDAANKSTDATFAANSDTLYPSQKAVGTYVQAAIPSSTGGAPNFSANQIVGGGGVEWTSGYSFTVGAATYTIAGTQYSSVLTNVTLATPDPTNDRIDVIGFDTTGSVFTITGTPAPTPSQPTVDPSTQLAATFILVNHGSSVPTQITKFDIYHQGTEWTASKSGSPINLTSTNNPYDDTKDVEATNSTTGNFANFQNGTTLDISTVNSLVFYLRSKATWASTRSITIQWNNGGTVKGTPIVLRDGQFGFKSSTTSSYQQISIPTSLFQLAGVLVNAVRFTVSGTGATIGWYLDDITLQGGASASGLPTNLLTWRGAWNATAGYNVNDTVNYNQTAWVALIANTNSAPSTSNANWAALGGSAIPASAAVLGSNGSNVPGAATAHGIITPLNCNDTSGSGSAQSCTTTPSFTPAAKDCIIYNTTTSNTGALTLNVNSTSAAAVQKWLGTALASGDMPANKPHELCYDGTNWQASTIGNAPNSGTSTITTLFGPQDCTTDQTGNNAYTTATMTNWFDAHWEFVFAQASEIYCKVRIPHAVAGTPNAKLVLELRANDATAGHTANFKTCDNVITAAASYQVSALTCAANQAYTTTSTAYGRVTLTYNVQSTVAADNMLVIGIATSTTGTAPTANMLVDIYFEVDQTL
jgi:hypothetical protein